MSNSTETSKVDPAYEKKFLETLISIINSNDNESESIMDFLERLIPNNKFDKIDEALKKASNVKHLDTIICETGIHIAVEFGNLDMVKFFLDKGTSVDSREENGATCLVRSIIGAVPSQEIAMELIERGADLWHFNCNGWVALTGAAMANMPEVIEKILAHTNKTINMRFVKKHHDREPEEDTPLTFLAHMGSPDSVKLLISLGADVNYTTSDGTTPLMHATTNEDGKEILFTLLEEGADIDMEDSQGDTALQWAIEENEIEIVEELVYYGADIMHKNKKGISILEYAYESEETKEIAEFLSWYQKEFK